MAKGKNIKVTQVRSLAARSGRCRDTISALGLGRIGKSSILPVNKPILGMLEKVAHLVSIESVK